MLRATSMIAALVAGAIPADAQQTYSAQEVFQAFYSVVSEAFPTNREQYLSMSIVGAVADKEDRNAINELANTCPPRERYVASYYSLVHLDAIYQKALEGMIGPSRPKSQKYLDAKAYLSDQDVISTYNDYQNAYIEAMSAYIAGTDPKKRPELLARAQIALKNWKVYGSKGEVDAALLTLDTEGGGFSDSRIADHVAVLDSYKGLGLDHTDPLSLITYKSPVSEVSPPRDKWDEPEGWVKISFDHSQFSKYYSSTTSGKSGFGGLSLGFVTVGATSGGNKTQETRVSNVRSFSYSFELKRVGIVRPWLDTRIFTQPGAWTWKRNPNTTEFPYISYGSDGDGTPQVAPASVYDNAPIFCPMIPLEMIIARNRTITATTSKSDYSLITTSGSSGGGGGFSFLFGGTKKTWTTQNVTENGDDVTFTVEAPGTAVVGFISGLVPELPMPNPNDTWSEEAWRP